MYFHWKSWWYTFSPQSPFQREALPLPHRDFSNLRPGIQRRRERKWFEFHNFRVSQLQIQGSWENQVRFILLFNLIKVIFITQSKQFLRKNTQKLSLLFGFQMSFLLHTLSFSIWAYFNINFWLLSFIFAILVFFYQFVTATFSS